MLILLPPSETKSTGSSGAPLDLAGLSWPQLTDVRRTIAEDLVALSADRGAAMAALKLGPTLAAEADANAALFTSPTMPALDRYTGVLFDALDAGSLSPSARSHLAVGSALFGVVGGEDMIPKYRLSGSSKLPRTGGDGNPPTMRARWGKSITEALAEGDHGMIVDLRSGTYMNLGKVPGAVTATVLTTDGKVVSHFNKHHKGLLARALADAAGAGARSRSPETLGDAVDVARAAGLDADSRDGGIIVTVPSQ